MQAKITDGTWHKVSEVSIPEYYLALDFVIDMESILRELNGFQNSSLIVDAIIDDMLS